MNIDRVFRVMNCFFQLCGYQLHWFERKSRRFRLTLCGVANFVAIALVYAVCFNQHFEHSELLNMLQDVSPFLKNLVHLQLLLGLKMLVFSVYELRFITRAANGLLEVLPKVYAKRFNKDEAFAYFLLFSTLLISLGFVLYIAYEMQFKLPPLDHIFIGSALFIPHFMLACSLKFYTVGSWLFRQALVNLADDFERILGINQASDMKGAQMQITIVPIVEAANLEVCLPDASRSVEQPLQEVGRQMEELVVAQRRFNEAFQKQLTLLIGLNNNCLLAGCYSLVYFKSTWHVIFSERSKRIFLAANYGIFVFIFWDYLCLCLANGLFEKIRLDFYANVLVVLKVKKSQYTKRIRSLVKDLRALLADDLKFKILGVYSLSGRTLLLMQSISGFVIALIVIYNYLNDKLIELSIRFEEGSGD